jgi:hypothetical protein
MYIDLAVNKKQISAFDWNISEHVGVTEGYLLLYLALLLASVA